MRKAIVALLLCGTAACGAGGDSATSHVPSASPLAARLGAMRTGQSAHRLGAGQSQACSPTNPYHASSATGVLRTTVGGLFSYNSGDRVDRGLGEGWQFALDDSAELLRDADGTRVLVHEGLETYVLPISYRGAYPYWPAQRPGYRAELRGDDLVIERGHASSVAVYRAHRAAAYHLAQLRTPYDVATYAYGSDHRLARIEHTNACQHASVFERDASGRLQRFETDLDGHATTARLRYEHGLVVEIALASSGGASMFALGYDAGRRLASIREASDVERLLPSDAAETRYGYDDDGRLTSSVAGSLRQTWRYEPTRTLSVLETDAGKSEMEWVIERCEVTRESRDGVERASRTIETAPFDRDGFTLPLVLTETVDGTTHAMRFDPRTRLVASRTTRQGELTIVESNTYNDAGLLTKQVAEVGAHKLMTTYGYDAARRLVMVKGPRDDARTTYDAQGLVVARRSNGRASVTSYDTQGRVTRHADLVTGIARTFAYDEACHLRETVVEAAR